MIKYIKRRLKYIYIFELPVMLQSFAVLFHSEFFQVFSNVKY